MTPEPSIKKLSAPGERCKERSCVGNEKLPTRSSNDCREVVQWRDLHIASTSRRPSHVWLPNGFLSAAVKWQRTRLNRGRARTPISCEENVSLSSQTCSGADGLINLLPSCDTPDWLKAESRRRETLSLLPPKDLEDNCDKLLTPGPRSGFSRTRGGALPGQTQTTKGGMEATAAPFTLSGLGEFAPLRPVYSSASSGR